MDEFLIIYSNRNLNLEDVCPMMLGLSASLQLFVGIRTELMMLGILVVIICLQVYCLLYEPKSTVSRYAQYQKASVHRYMYSINSSTTT